MKLQYVGIAWYRKENWEKLLEIFEDAHVLPSTYNQWLKQAEDILRREESLGRIVEKAYIDPETFPAWCRERGLNVDAKARMEFGNDFVARKYLRKNG
jgi:hypothetical protein